jgi:hypothetical protein
MRQISKIFMTATVGLIAASCGTGTGGGQTAGIDRGGVISGPVTGYGSIWVNGRRYATADAQIEINGQPAGERDLEIGQVVVLNSILSDDSLSAERVVYESNLQGPVDVDSRDVAAGSFMALGQQIVVESGTLFDSSLMPAALIQLADGDVVEVSGLTDADGRIRATLITRADAFNYELQLSGVVSSSISGRSFTINGQTVVYDHSGFLGYAGQPFPEGQSPQVGDRVRVTVIKEVAEKFGAAGEVLASTVSYRGSAVQVDDGDEGEIEGLIANCSGSSFCSSFNLAGFRVVVNEQTDYEDGSLADLANNVRVEAEGVFDFAGVLQADEIEFRPENAVEIESPVDGPATVTTDNAGQSIYSIAVAGIAVETTSLTLIKGESKSFTPLELKQGDYLRVRGSWDGSKVIASLFEQTGVEGKSKFTGLLTAANEPYVQVLNGELLQSDSETEFEGAGISSATDFFVVASACLLSSEGCQIEVEWQEGVVIKLALQD